MTDVLEELQAFRKIYVEYPKKLHAAREELRRIENERQDLLHVIELGSLDAIGMSRISQQLKKVQVRRRNLKNNIEVLDEVRKYIATRNQKEQAINSMIGRVRTTIEKQGRRTYTMRVRPDLQNLIRK